MAAREGQRGGRAKKGKHPVSEDDKKTKLIEQARDRHETVPCLELEYALLFPRPANFLQKLPGISSTADHSCRLRIFRTIVDPGEVDAALLQMILCEYRARPQSRFELLHLLSVWFDLRPRNFLAYIHVFFGLAHSIDNDGRLLIKHLLSILREATYIHRFLILPISHFDSRLCIRYSLNVDHFARYTGANANDVANRFLEKDAKQGFSSIFKGSDVEPTDIAKFFCLIFASLMQMVTLDLFALDSPEIDNFEAAWEKLSELHPDAEFREATSLILRAYSLGLLRSESQHFEIWRRVRFCVSEKMSEQLTKGDDSNQMKLVIDKVTAVRNELDKSPIGHIVRLFVGFRAEHAESVPESLRDNFFAACVQPPEDYSLFFQIGDRNPLDEFTENLRVLRVTKFGEAERIRRLEELVACYEEIERLKPIFSIKEPVDPRVLRRCIYAVIGIAYQDPWGSSE
jgi:hypothetical protein